MSNCWASFQQQVMSSPHSGNALEELVIGYPKLSGQMEIVPETAIFRRFGALNARNLLYMQSELMALEKDLIKQELADSVAPEKCKYALDWYWLSQSKAPGDTKQLDLVLKVREMIREYNMSLLLQARICSLPEPDREDLHDLQKFLQMREMGPLALNGDDASIWGSVTTPDTHRPDLVALRSRSSNDPFSGWITTKLVQYFAQCWCARFKKRSRLHGQIEFRDDLILRITMWITTLFASLLPVASIAVLYSVHSVSYRLWIIAAFNLLISICLGVLTSAKRAEIFAVSAAITAVQVVFISMEHS
ncbi:hypothetical protein P280DRAFT_468343 [Massarina eburnea CBS 473.64]|uniref:DUF6594 domain-containing protein n=1 Tax=Massarina eburnea CBS 473.64 TaxID=1395130 RepID=A0A6A6S2P6_9PLEO|nr:hypothetical protein P280DRAFT_468343 [Massarina eburnea CBS 473.64]